MRILIRLTYVLLAAVVASLVAPAAAGAGELVCTGYPQPTLSPSEGPTGTVVTISAGPDESGCVPRSDVEFGTTAFVTIGTEPQTDALNALATTEINGDGSWSTTWTVPDGTPAGDITLYATAWTEVDLNVNENAGIDGAAALADFPVIDYDPLTFTVTAPATTSTTQQETTTTTGATTSTTTAPATIRVSKADLVQGEEFIVYGTGFEPGSTVEIWMESTPRLLGTAIANSVGDVQATVAVPADMPVGPHNVRLTGTALGGGVLSLSTGVTVGALVGTTVTTVSAVGQAVRGTLPRTGSSPFGTVALAVALVAVGAGALVVRRRVSAH